MATEEGVVPSTKAISEAFVEQYYLNLSQRTKEAHRLYVDSSFVSRPGPDGSMISFNSLEAINEQFLCGDYENATFEVLSVDYQSSLEAGLCIMVIGFFTGKDNIKRKFSQMFYLVPQGNYVVVNDIFRYVDEEPSTPKTLPVAESVTATEMVKPADVLKKTKIDAPVEKKSVNAAEAKKVVAPLDNGKKHSDDKALAAKKPTATVAETVAPQLDGGKRSYSDIARSMADSVAPIQAKFPVQKPKYTGQPSPVATPKAPASVSNSEKKKAQRTTDEPGTSIFVANLPMNAMPPQLFELFKEFGPIKENGVQVRSSSTNNGVCFGFVAFESAASVQSVLKAAKHNPFMLADRKLRVKEKEVDYNGSKPSKTAAVVKTGDGSKPAAVVKTGDGSKSQNGGSADGEDDGFIKVVRNRKNQNQNQNGDSADGGDDDFIKVVRNRKNQNGGSAVGGGDELKPSKNRRNSRRRERNANGDKNDQKNSEGRGPKVQA